MSRLHRASSVGIEIGPERVVAVALSERNRRIAALCERSIESEHGMADAVYEATASLKAKGPARIVLLGSLGQHTTLQLPPMGGKEAESAADLQLSELLDAPIDSKLVTMRLRRGSDGSRTGPALAVDRHPIEDLCASIEAAGPVVTGITIPASMVVTEASDASPGSMMWVDLGGSRTVLTIAFGDQIRLSREIPTHQGTDEDDEMARFEQQIAVFQEIERSILYHRQMHGSEQVKRLVLSGTFEAIDAFVEQFRDPLENRGLTIDRRDVLAPVSADPGLSTAGLRRSGLAVRAALASKRTLTVRPAYIEHRAGQDRRWAVAIGATAALAVGAFFGSEAAKQSALELDYRLEDLRSELDIVPEELDPQAAAQRFEVRAERPAAWEDVLMELGRAAPAGVDLDRVTIENTTRPARLEIEGRVAGGPRQSGERLAGLLRDLQRSPFAAGLAVVLADGDLPTASDGSVGFALELPVRPEVLP